MKITDFFSSSQSPNKEKERPVSTPAINTSEQQKESMSLGGSIKIQTPRKKKQRFTDPEVHNLVDTILLHINKLYGPKALNTSGKAAIWDQVVREVNKVGGMRRTTKDCKKRWLDYRRKVKTTFDNWKKQSSMGGQMLPLSEIFPKRQLVVIQFFKMDASDGQKLTIRDESSSDIEERVSSNVLTPSYIIDSEDEFFAASQNKSFSPSSCLPSTSYQDKLISQSSEETQAASEPSNPHNTKAVDMSILPHASTEPQLQLETQMDQLVAQQKNISEMLQSFQKNVTASLNIQNKMYSLMKDSFLELQKTLLSSQKASSDQSSILELRLNRVDAKLDEMNGILRVKQLQEMMYSDESELSISGTQDVRSTPTATCTPKKSTLARKRALNQSPSPTGFKKKAKQI